MNPVGNLREEQWDVCDRCGRYRPLSLLVRQLGQLVCLHKKTCFDDLTVLRRDQIIADKMAKYLETEGQDMRYVNEAFYNAPDEVEF